MITAIELEHFKCFRTLNLRCGPLNLLCGLNGTGKSSVIQGILVLRQSFETGELSPGRLRLGGERIDLGTGTDVIYDGADADFLRVVCTSDERQTAFDLTLDYSRTANEFVAATKPDHDASAMVEYWYDVQPFSGHLVYVTAERLGPRKSYLRSERHARIGEFGNGSEYAWNYLAMSGSKTVKGEDPRCLKIDGLSSMRNVLDTWLQEISPGAHLVLDDESAAAADAIIPGFSFDQPGDVPTRPYRATNVGFGLSYTLPVILAFLSEPGTLCLIENPEAHLHPRGQTKLGELAARAASAGVQIFVETHSDHFMDGVRIAVRDGLITPEDVTFNYFQREGNTATVTSPTINEDGRLSDWPEGFFDQNALNLARLLAPKS